MEHGAYATHNSWKNRCSNSLDVLLFFFFVFPHTSWKTLVILQWRWRIDNIILCYECDLCEPVFYTWHKRPRHNHKYVIGILLSDSGHSLCTCSLRKLWLTTNWWLQQRTFLTVGHVSMWTVNDRWPDFFLTQCSFLCCFHTRIYSKQYYIILQIFEAFITKYGLHRRKNVRYFLFVWRISRRIACIYTTLLQKGNGISQI